MLSEATNPIIRWEWVVEEWDQVWDAIVEHVTLTMMAMTLGLIVSSILAAIALRHRWAMTPITATGEFDDMISAGARIRYVPATPWAIGS